MAEYIVMPKLGLTMTEGTLTEWLVKEGDSIKKGDLIFVVETDKITKEFESPQEGTLLKILLSAGTAEVKKPIAIIGQAGEDISALLAEAGSSSSLPAEEPAVAATEAKPKTVLPEENKKIKISPKAKRLARELGIDYSNIQGTAKNGAITEEDIIKAKESADRAKEVKATPMARIEAEKAGIALDNIPAEGRIRKDDVRRARHRQKNNQADAILEERIPLTGMRKTIAKHMAASQQESATVNYSISCDMTEISRIREKMKAKKKVSFNDIIIYLVSRVLVNHPYLNSRLDGNELVLNRAVHMGVAVAVKDGLLVPVVRDSDLKSISQISEETKTLADACREGKIQPDDLIGSTFTITNLGMFGIEAFTPIINQPNMAILGINAIKNEVDYIDGEFCLRPRMTLSLTADHRIVDGSVAAAFLSELKASLEEPSLLML